MGRLLAQCLPYISPRSSPFAIILFAMHSHWKPAPNSIKFITQKQGNRCMNRVFTATCVTTPVAVSLHRTMTNRRSKAKKSTSKPKGTTQPSSSKVKLTIPARPTATQHIQPRDVSIVQPVASTPVLDPPKASSPHHRTPSVGPQSEDEVIITPRPKTPPCRVSEWKRHSKIWIVSCVLMIQTKGVKTHQFP